MARVHWKEQSKLG